jgi:hypothetical protein
VKKTISKLAAALGAAAVLSAGSVGAATLDFIKHIDGFGATPGVGEKAMEGTPFSSVFVPIATTARGYTRQNPSSGGIKDDAPYAYFDGNQAGIGVCKVLVAGNQCSPSNDDNVTAGEILGLSWGSDVLLQSLSFRGEAHPSDPAFGANDEFDYSTDGGGTWFTKQLINAKQGVVSFGGLFLGANQQILLAFNNQQFYVSAAELTAVPIPAAAWLLGSGLAGLFAIGRRRRTVAITA